MIDEIDNHIDPTTTVEIIPYNDSIKNCKIVDKNNRICPHESCAIIDIPDDYYKRPCDVCVWYNPDADWFCQFPMNTLELQRKYEVDESPCRFHLTFEELNKIMMPYWS